MLLILNTEISQYPAFLKLVFSSGFVSWAHAYPSLALKRKTCCCFSPSGWKISRQFRAWLINFQRLRHWRWDFGSNDNVLLPTKSLMQLHNITYFIASTIWVHCSKQCRQYISETSRDKFLGRPRVKPEATGCEARTLSNEVCTP